MDRNTVIGFVLIAVLIITYTYFTMPSKEELEKQKHQADSIALVQKQHQFSDSLQQMHSVDSAKVVATPASGQVQNIFPDSNATKQLYTIENEVLKVTL